MKVEETLKRLHSQSKKFWQRFDYYKKKNPELDMMTRRMMGVASWVETCKQSASSDDENLRAFAARELCRLYKEFSVAVKEELTALLLDKKTASAVIKAIEDERLLFLLFPQIISAIIENPSLANEAVALGERFVHTAESEAKKRAASLIASSYMTASDEEKVSLLQRITKIQTPLIDEALSYLVAAIPHTAPPGRVEEWMDRVLDLVKARGAAIVLFDIYCMAYINNAKIPQSVVERAVSLMVKNDALPVMASGEA